MGAIPLVPGLGVDGHMIESFLLESTGLKPTYSTHRRNQGSGPSVGFLSFTLIPNFCTLVEG